MYRCLEIIYYKVNPPLLLAKPFRSIKEFYKMKMMKEAKKEVHALVDLSEVRVDEYIAYETPRDILAPISMKLFEIIIDMIRSNEWNSEASVKYQSILYQHYILNEQYETMYTCNPYFKSTELPNKDMLPVIRQIFTRTFKNSHLVENFDIHAQERSQ